MGRTLTAIILAAIIAGSARADVAVVLTDQHRLLLIQSLGLMLQNQPMASPSITILLDRLNTAPVVVRDPPPQEDLPKGN